MSQTLLITGKLFPDKDIITSTKQGYDKYEKMFKEILLLCTNGEKNRKRYYIFRKELK